MKNVIIDTISDIHVKLIPEINNNKGGDGCTGCVFNIVEQSECRVFDEGDHRCNEHAAIWVSSDPGQYKRRSL